MSVSEVKSIKQTLYADYTSVSVRAELVDGKFRGATLYAENVDGTHGSEWMYVEVVSQLRVLHEALGEIIEAIDANVVEVEPGPGIRIH